MSAWAQVLIGVPIVLAPGLALVWAWAPGLDWAKFVFASVIISLTIPPATMYVANVFFGVPVTGMNSALIFLAWGTLGLALGAAPRLDRLLEA